MPNDTARTKLAVIPLKDIRENSKQVRKFYNRERLKELAASFQETGALQPIIVKPIAGGKYELIVGSRRLRAAKQKSMRAINAVVMNNVDACDMLIIGLAENLQRESLTPFEEAAGILSLVKDHALTQKQIATRIGRSPSFIRARLRLIDLPKEVQEAIGRRQLSLAHVETIQRIPTSAGQVRAARVVTRHRLAPKDLQALIDKRPEAEKDQHRGQSLKGFSSKKLSLRIQRFTSFLHAMKEQLHRLSPDQKEEIKKAIHGLRMETENILTQCIQ